MVRNVVSVDPLRCRLWSLHDRLQDQITAASCTAEIQSFREHGQMIPVLGRPLHADPHYDIELIYGARRLFVARLLEQRLVVELRELTDRQAIIALDIENRHRQNVSPYERGLSYARWLRAGHFDSQEKMACELQVSTAHVSRLLKLARLPSVVVSAFGSGTRIREAWGLELVDLLSDPSKRQPVLRAARAISASPSRPAPLDVFDRLVAAGTRQRCVKASSHDVVIKDRRGGPLFRIRRQTHEMSWLLPLDRISASTLQTIEQAITRILVCGRRSQVTVEVPQAHGLVYPVLHDGRVQALDQRA